MTTRMREFTYLVGAKKPADGDGAKTRHAKSFRTAKNTVLLAMTQAELRTKPVLWNQKNFHYYVFDNIDELMRWHQGLSAGEANFYEVIFGAERQRLKFDIDHVTSAAALGVIMEAIRSTWRSTMGLAAATSEAPTMMLFRTSEAGFHVVIDHFVANVGEAKAFADKVIAALPAGDGTGAVLDPKVYAATQNFRLVGSSKVGSPWRKTLINGQKIDFRQTLIREY